MKTKSSLIIEGLSRVEESVKSLENHVNILKGKLSSLKLDISVGTNKNAPNEYYIVIYVKGENIKNVKRGKWNCIAVYSSVKGQKGLKGFELLKPYYFSKMYDDISLKSDNDIDSVISFYEKLINDMKSFKFTIDTYKKLKSILQEIDFSLFNVEDIESFSDKGNKNFIKDLDV